MNDDLEKNVLSYFVSRCLKKLNKLILVSYADRAMKHTGYIYQATNWIYQGCGDFQLAPTYSLRVNEEDDWMHSRSVYSKYGSAAPKNLMKAICLLYTSPSPRDLSTSRMPSSA